MDTRKCGNVAHFLGFLAVGDDIVEFGVKLLDLGDRLSLYLNGHQGGARLRNRAS